MEETHHSLHVRLVCLGLAGRLVLGQQRDIGGQLVVKRHVLYIVKNNGQFCPRQEKRICQEGGDGKALTCCLQCAFLPSRLGGHPDLGYIHSRPPYFSANFSGSVNSAI
ncbi:hypothetical protein E2C01_013245 [Portunus trituberculatus]|uniref:Secreted protein n=1 Tax=Portunus trituberculatus TaxID=210409 RepID=A0A5B7DG44_PORTR|nr:hypothetical protein [Portunus trituberculatus]